MQTRPPIHFHLTLYNVGMLSGMDISLSILQSMMSNILLNYSHSIINPSENILLISEAWISLILQISTKLYIPYSIDRLLTLLPFFSDVIFMNR